MVPKICSVDGCNSSVRARGWCSGHWQRWKKHGDPGSALRAKKPGSSEVKNAKNFWDNVAKSDDCWTWVGCKSWGYGVFTADRERKLAHRISWTHFNGPIPDRMVIDHLCHNPSCVNPSHLRMATQKQNMENRKGAPRNSKSGIRGVRWVPARNKWRAEVKSNGKTISLGYFCSIEEADDAARTARQRLFTISN